MLGDDGLHRSRADLLLALDEEGDADWGLAVEGTNGSQMGGDATFVVGGATTIETLTFGGGDEGFSMPLIKVAGGLDVTVGVQQDSGHTLRRRPVGDDSGKAVVLRDDGDVGGTGLLGSGGNELGSGPHAVGPLGTNRPDCHVAGELLNGIVETRINLGRQVLESMRKIHDQSVGPSPRLIVGL